MRDTFLEDGLFSKFTVSVLSVVVPGEAGIIDDIGFSHRPAAGYEFGPDYQVFVVISIHSWCSKISALKVRPRGRASRLGCVSCPVSALPDLPQSRRIFSMASAVDIAC